MEIILWIVVIFDALCAVGIFVLYMRHLRKVCEQYKMAT